MAITKQNNSWILIPFFGICLFILLYIIATFFYPGGSFNDKSASGFSWVHNYWCELLATQSKNGQANTARPIAISAMIVLAISLSLFWYFASFLFAVKTWGRAVIRYAGIGSMITAVFLATATHDLVINTAGALGCLAITATLVALYKKHSYSLFWLGLFCLLLCVLNNYIYYTGQLFDYLAIIQKISFLFFLLWFCLVDLLLYRRK